MIIRLYFQEEQQFKILGLKAYNFGYVKEYIDYTANVLLRLLVYRVINESNVESINVIKELSDKIDELIEKQLGRRKMEWTDQKENGHNDLDAETVSECFSAYVTHRSKFYEEYGIKEVLKDEMLNSLSLFEKVPIEYKAEKRIVSEDEFKSIKDTITEGKTIDRYT